MSIFCSMEVKRFLLTSKFQLYEPYTDNPTTNGFMRLDPEILFDVIPKYLRDGWQVVCSDNPGSRKLPI